jgi:hypothetical protein
MDLQGENRETESIRQDSNFFQEQPVVEVTRFGYPLGYPLQAIPAVSSFPYATRVYRTRSGSAIPDYLSVRAAFGVPSAALARLTPRSGPHGPTTGGGGWEISHKCPKE